MLRKKSIRTLKGATFASDADVTFSSHNLKVSSPTVYAQGRSAPPITTFYPPLLQPAKVSGKRISMLQTEEKLGTGTRRHELILCSNTPRLLG